jgi:ABC-type Mn2+/Zn2+ transport system permease subunit
MCGWIAVVFGVVNSIWTDMPVGPLIVFGAAITMLIFRSFIFLKVKF